MSQFLHDPIAGPLDYSIDFTDSLSEGDDVSTVDWSIIPSGPTLNNSSMVDGIASIQVSEAEFGKQYLIKGLITTTNGLVYPGSVTIRGGHR